ncbi:DUF927 domain-containing protein [Falsiroseomonas sp.]|uniref:DUF927 domain-containing protein n=1 Tax=Falsiroseomonas sp. TaxID=2870721 RepID=UPI003565D2D5
MEADPFAPIGATLDISENNTGADSMPMAILPAPRPLPLRIEHPRYGAPSAVWLYRNAAGALLFAACRFDPHNDKKQILPYCCTQSGWRWMAPPPPRPLYGLDRLAARPDAAVLVVEGEKAADAGAALFPDYVVITWPGGCNAVGMVDVAPLRGRKLTFLPDADAPGRKAMQEMQARAIGAGASCAAVVQIPEDWPEGWDIADLEDPDRAKPADVSAHTIRAMMASAEREAEITIGVPLGFCVTQDGVFYVKPGEDSAAPVRVCGPLRVVAATNDGAGSAWGVLLEWEDADGQCHEWPMPRAALASDGASVRARLMEGGLYIAPRRGARDLLAEYLLGANPTARVRVVPRTGWHEMPGGRVFVLPTGAIGPASAGRVMLASEQQDFDLPLVRVGTLAEWQGAVAALAVGNSRLAFVIASAFAAPLLALLDAEGGGFHLRGASSIGKSTALHAAGSVWGGGGVRGWSRSWRATDNALEGTASMHTDMLLCLDEMGEAGAETVASAAYMLANGSGKARAGRDGRARRSATWRVLFLSTGEEGIADRLAEARGGAKRVRAGQEVRILDIPAEAGPLGLFEHLHGFGAAGALADAVKAGAARFYGTAGRAWLEMLAADPDGIAQAARQQIEGFVSTHCPEGANGQVRRAAGRFALVAAAGELATDRAILAWPPGEALRAAATCFAAWLAARPGGKGAAEDAAAIEAVKKFIGLYGTSRFSEIFYEGAEASQITGIRAGWRKRIGGEWCYLFLPEIWKTEVVPGMDPTAAAKAIDKGGYLVRSGEADGRLQRNEKVGLPKNVRVYVVRETILTGGDEE